MADGLFTSTISVVSLEHWGKRPDIRMMKNLVFSSKKANTEYFDKRTTVVLAFRFFNRNRGNIKWKLAGTNHFSLI